MLTSFKGLNERHRLHAYVSTSVYDKSWKATTEQFILHFHEQFRQLDEVTPMGEHLPHSVRLTFLHVGSTQVPFLMCTLEIPQKLQHKFLLLTFVICFTLELLSQL